MFTNNHAKSTNANFKTINFSSSDGMVDEENQAEIDHKLYSRQTDDYNRLQSHLIETTIDSQGVGTVEDSGKPIHDRKVNTSQAIFVDNGNNQTTNNSSAGGDYPATKLRQNKQAFMLGQPIQNAASSTAYGEGRPWRISGKAQSVGHI